jgi:fructokinase
MKKIICVGSATKDIFIVLKETKIIDNSSDVTAKKLMAFEFGAKEYAEELREEIGGSAVNVAAGLAQAGIRSFVFARTSRDKTGKWILKNISKKGVKKNYMQQNGKTPNEVSVIISDKEHQDHIILRSGDSVENFDLEKALNKFREKTDWIFVASQKKGWQEKMAKIKEFAENKKAKIALNPSSFQISQDAKELKEVLSCVDILFLNRDEAIELIKNIEEDVKDDTGFLLDKLKFFGLKVVVITDGENGADVGNSEGNYHLDICVDKINDTVGTGDAFASGFLASFVEDKDARKALCWGMANSGSVVTGVGGTQRLLKRKEMKKKEEELINKIKEI